VRGRARGREINAVNRWCRGHDFIRQGLLRGYQYHQLDARLGSSVI